jgi:hypothetical protein
MPTKAKLVRTSVLQMKILEDNLVEFEGKKEETYVVGLRTKNS